MKVPSLHKDTKSHAFLQQSSETSTQEVPYSTTPAIQLSTKKAWRLKKYSKTDDEIKLEQQKYENLEFTPNKTSNRRPRNKPGQSTQEFVFVDLSPRKKESNQERDEIKTPKKQGSRVSRLFRLTSSSQETMKEEIISPAQTLGPSLLDDPDCSPEVADSRLSLSQSNTPRHPGLKRSYTNTLSKSQYGQQRTRSNSSASLIMTISDSGRAILQPSTVPVQPQQQHHHQPTLSATSSTSDLSSLHTHSMKQNYYARSPIPSPKRMESPIPQDRYALHPSYDFIPKYSLDPTSTDEEEEEEESDALKAFSKAVKRSNGRKRANTNSSQTSNQSIVSPILSRTLSRNHSVSSMSSIYGKSNRISPSRAALLRKATTPAIQTQDFVFGDGSTASGSYFDDSVKVHKPKAFQHKKQISISVLGPPLHIDGEDDNGFTDESESPFEFHDEADAMSFHARDMDDLGTAPSTAFSETGFPKLEGEEIFDFNSFINYDSHEY